MRESLPVFVINLARDAPRRAHMEALLAKTGQPGMFVPAVDGGSLSALDQVAYDPIRALRHYGKAMRAAEIGCYLSHYRLWQRVLDERRQAALILEDDIDIDLDLPDLITRLLACPDWLVVRLHSMRTPVLHPRTEAARGERVAALGGGRGLYRLGTHTLGAAAYLIRAEGARRLLAHGRRIVRPVDQTMDRFWENGIAPYVVRPFPVRQLPAFESSIGARPPGAGEDQPADIVLARRLERLRDSVKRRVYLLTS
ncbi:MAG: glycosyltransferase family 25 protein [Rhodospirillales bacterium]|jgi:glycosyl transferase family 25|nr:glycosyltransferase family 25 protein [Rhodospirillales bacterium]